MSFRTVSWITLAAAAGLLVAGCRTESPRDTAAHSGKAAAVPPRAPRAPAVSEADLVDAHAHYCMGVIYDQEDQPAQALTEYNQAALRDPTNEELVLQVSGRLLEAGETDKALELLSRATARPGASGALYARLGYVYSKLGKLDPAIHANRLAVRREPLSIVGYQNLFLNYLQAHHTRQALRVLDAAAAAPRAGPRFLLRVGELYTGLGLQAPSLKSTASARAVKVLDRVQNSGVTDTELRLRLADGFNLLGKDSAAARLYEQLLHDLPDAPLARQSIRRKLAALYVRDGDSQGAARELRALLRDNPTDVRAYYSLGGIAYYEKNYSAAADAFARVLLLDPGFQPAYFDLAYAQLAQDQNAAALETLRQARRRFRSTFTLEYLTGAADTGLKDYTNALAHFTTAEIIAQATDTNQLTDVFYFQFGAACERSGDYGQAEKYLEKSLRLSPNFAEALNYLGFMWADRGENLRRARLLIQKALKTDPRNAAYLDSMGWVLFKLRQPRAALDYLLSAIKCSGQPDPTLYDHLGDIYAALHDAARAHAAWEKSLALKPDERVRQKLGAAAAR